jgi:hypothetical protein
MGAIGLQNMRVSLPREIRSSGGISEPIYENELMLRRTLTDTSSNIQQALIDEFLVELYDLAGVTR